MYSLGIDIGSSSIKVSIFDIKEGVSKASASFPEKELDIISPEKGWAEQDPSVWWDCFLKAFSLATAKSAIPVDAIVSIGISYQMHGLVLVDKEQKVLRSSIIWCDSRAVPYGEKAFAEIGEHYCVNKLLNSPGNFTAAKLAWVKENEPGLFSKVHKFMLPGDFIAMKLSGNITTTATGLSEGIFWDFNKRQVSEGVLGYFGFHSDMVPELVPAFGVQSSISAEISKSTGLNEGTPIAYRAGDQPNNAFSLNVLNPGEVAATAGTSGVIYAVTDENTGDKLSRVNTFLHVNDNEEKTRNGILLCVNGTGILNSWLRKNIASENISYEEMNELAAQVEPGSEGLFFYPFGNGAERIFLNKLLLSSMENLDFNRHNSSHVFRAAQEGIVFALKYGFDVLNQLGVEGKTIRAGKANMFLSPVFREVFVNTINADLELYETDGAEGAARGAALGAGFYTSEKEAFKSLKCLGKYSPEPALQNKYRDLYNQWKTQLQTKHNL